MKKKLYIIALSFLMICHLFAIKAFVGDIKTFSIKTIGQGDDFTL